MEIRILSKRENKILARDEIEGVIFYTEGTPKREEIIAKIADEVGVEKERIVVDLKQRFGKKEVMFFAKIYISKEELERIEGRRK